MPPKALVVCLLVLVPVVVGALIVPADGAAQVEPAPIEAIRDSCGTFNPFFVTTQFSHVAGPRDTPDETAIIAFRHTGSDDVDQQIALAKHEQVGAVYGLAYDFAREQLYASAYHKRATAHGPGGPGQIYRLDLPTGAVEPLVALPNQDRHEYGENEDTPAAEWVGVAGIGDIDLDADSNTLFATNMMENRIYRISVPDGQILGTLRHGAAAEDWAANARLFGLAFHEGRLFHGVVDSRKRTAPGSLMGVVYRSLPDGSDMEEVARILFDYERTPRWVQWDLYLPSRISTAYSQPYSEPMLADIEFTASGDMVIGIRDRLSDMLPVLDRLGRQPGVGEIVLARAEGDKWVADPQTEWYDDLVVHGVTPYDESAWGGLARFPGFDLVVSAARAPTRIDGVGSFWFWNRTGSRMWAESWALIASDRKPHGANGAGDVESLCPPTDDPNPGAIPTATRAAARATTRAIATQTAAAALWTPTPVPNNTPANFPTVVAEACLTDNPYAVTVCYPLVMNFGQAGVDAPTIVIFRNTPANSPLYMAASHKAIGSTWGLAYSSGEGAIYAAAFHKRLVEFGPDGTGAIYRIDVGTGAISTFAVVPGTGKDTHSEPGLREPDAGARNWVGKVSLGDLDLSTDERELFVMNLNDQTVYRYDVASGALLSSFKHGAAAEPWSGDARPFGLKFHQGRLYHGVVNSAAASGQASDLVAHVYSSLPDGTDMTLELAFDLDYARGTARVPGVLNFPTATIPLDWLPWEDDYNDLMDKKAQLALYPQPILADIEFLANGDMVLGLRDRHSDMALSRQIQLGVQIRKPGVGLGDALLSVRGPGGWSDPDTDYFQGAAVGDIDRTGMGSLAYIVPQDQPLISRVAPVTVSGWAPAMNEEVRWYQGKNPLQSELVCRVTTFPEGTPASQPQPEAMVPLHNEWVPSRSMGDVEVLCGPTPTISPTPVHSPTPTRTSIPSKTPSPTIPPSPTPTPTIEPVPIYLPVIVNDQCDPRYQHVDVVLVIDASTTMEFDTRAGRLKIDAAKEAARRFLDRMKFPGDQAAIVSFNVGVEVHQDLTGNRAALNKAIAGIEIEEFTKIHLGIAAAHDLLVGAQRIGANTPAMIVLTDGISNPDPVQMAIDAASLAKSDGITIYTVGLGEDIEVEALKQIASRPSLYRHAPDGEDLGPIYEEIAYEIPCPPSAYWPYRP